MITFPNAKINLGLYVERRRPDNYHDISTVFFPIPLTDVLEIIPSTETRLFTYGNAVACPTEKNLVMKAYHLLKEEFDIPPVDIHLHKHIPDGAGLGGGSSDAAFTATMLNEMFHLGLSDKELAQRVAHIGADCPFFIFNRAMAARGIGDKFEEIEINLSGMTIIVVKPEVSIPTAEAYAGVTPKLPEIDVTEIIRHPIEEWKTLLVNDFEASIFPKHPLLSDIKSSLYDAGAIYAAMSGSGSAIFAFFESDNMADRFMANGLQKGIFKLKI